MIFGIQMYHGEMQVKFEYGCDAIIMEGVITLGLRKLLENDSFCLENFLKTTVSVHFLSDGLMDSNYIWYTDVS
jgi:hypothetical protein